MAAVAAAHAQRLRSLVGRRLSATWLVWDLDADEWFADCPVLLDFAGEQVAVNHNKFDELSITWNQVEPADGPRWPTADPFRLAWRDDTPAELTALHGQPLQAVDPLEWTGSDLAEGTVAVAFTFPNGQVTIYNALDENGLTFDPPDLAYRRHP